MSQKSYNDTPTLYLIPTPIGNLDDITIRAIKTLEFVDIVFSEDTRVTSVLLNHLKIKKKLIALHEHNEDIVKVKILEYLKAGKNIGLVTDRGTPIISDPGFKCSQYIIENKFNVVGLPGPTALIPALIMSGIEPSPFLFYGFLNSKKGKREKELLQLKQELYTIIFYESPHRITECLLSIYRLFGNRQISISREISKKFEEVYRGDIKMVISETKEIKGEIVIIVEGNKEENTYHHLTVIEHINMYIKEGKSEMEAIKEVAKLRKKIKNDIYKEYHDKKDWFIMKLIVGLGNPGKEYIGTRHNIGFMMIDYFAEKYNLNINKVKHNGLFGVIENKIILLKPLLYMNLSGQVIKKYVDYYKIKIEDILIIHDDLDMDLGKIKIVKNSGSGGHNGIKDISLHLKTKDYTRLKIGVSNKNEIDPKIYVLNKFNQEELKIIFETTTKIDNFIEDFINIDYQKLTTKYNNK